MRVQVQDISQDWDVVLIKNISKNGALFSCQKELKEGMLLNLKINIPLSRDPVHCVGKVVRVQAGDVPKSYEAGVSFTEISDADAALITQTVENLRPKDQGK